MTDYFCDFSLGSNGSGTYASPFNTLSSAVSAPTFTSGDIVWIRRGGTLTLADTATVHQNFYAAKLVGWPTSTDVLYASRPTVARAVWDADTTVRPNIKKAYSSANGIPTFLVNAIFNIYIANLKLEHINNYVDTAADTCKSIFQSNPAGASATVSCFNVDIIKTYNAAATTQLAFFSVTCNYVSGFSFSDPIYLFHGCTITYNGSATPNYTENVTPFICNGTPDLISNNNFKLIATYYKTSFSCSNFVYNGYYNTKSSIFCGTVIGCTFEWTTYAKSDVVRIQNHDSGSSTTIRPLYIKDCKFITVSGAPGGNNAFEIRDGQASGNFQLIAENISAINFYQVNSYVLGGEVSYDQVNVSQAMYTYGPYICINSLSAPNLYLANIGDSYGRQYGSVPLVIIKNINASCGINRWTNCTVMVANIDGDVTTYKKYSAYGTTSLAAPARSGGEAFSIKMLATVNTLFGQMLCSHVRGLDTVFAAVASGARTLTVYGCYKGFSAQSPTQENIAIEVDAITAAGQKVLGTRSFAADTVALLSDTSTWTGIVGYTAFKIVLTFTAAGDQNVAIRFLTSLSEAGSELYFDPKPVVS